MKIGVMSDTHGHLDTMRQAASRMINEYGVSTIVHLGDDSTDADQLRSLSIEIISVPGVFEARYKDVATPNRIIREFEDVPFLLTHTPTRDKHDLEDDIDPTSAIKDGDVKVMLHGHSHKWRIDEAHGGIIINPGHLLPGDDRGFKESFAILDVEPKRLDVKIVSLDDGVIAEKTFFLEA